jgi:hypothetical protein
VNARETIFNAETGTRGFGVTAEGPGNTVDSAFDPILTVVPVDLPLDPCAATGPTKVQVVIPLANSGIGPDEVYARSVYVAWVSLQPVRHFRVRLDSMALLKSHDGTGACECTFFWMNVDRAPNGWIRLSDFATATMETFRPGTSRNFTRGATFDFFVLNGQSFTIRANGYDQDCLDGHVGHHDFQAHLTDSCLIDLAVNDIVRSQHPPENDKFQELKMDFGPGNKYRLAGASRRSLFLTPDDPNPDYALAVTIEELPFEEPPDR